MKAVVMGLFLLVFALFGAPLFIVIAAIAILAFSASGVDTSVVIVELFRLASAPTLIAIPLFTFAGYMLAESNTPKRLVEISQALFGWISGGLAIVVLVSCAVFTAFTGASGVTIVALGGLLYPILIQQQYPERFSLGLITTSGSLGLLFPPSLPIILYGVVAKQSVDQLFVAGILPGLLLVLLLSLYSVRTGFRAHVPRTPFSVRRLWKAVRGAIWEIPLPFIIIGGLYGGIFTATEAAAVTAFYVLLVEVFIYRDLKLFSDIPRVMRESMVLVGSILIILSTALGLTSYLIDEQVPMKILGFIKEFVDSPLLFLILLNVFLLIVGMMMDIFSAIIVVVPLIVPVAQVFGINPIHLGIIFLTNLEIGYLTPPVGLNLFISSFRFKEPVAKVYGAALPYIGMLLVALLVITHVPELSLWLVDLFGVR